MPIFNKRAELEARLGPTAPERSESRFLPPPAAPETEAEEPAEEPAVAPIATVPVDLDLPAPAPPPSPRPRRPDGATIFAPGTEFEGTLRAAEPVQVAGTFQGTLEAEGTVVVEDGGRLIARVVAPELIVAGYLDGKIQCQGRLEVRATGLVRGKIHVGTLRIEEGALLDGQLQMAGAAGATSISSAPEPDAARSRRPARAADSAPEAAAV
jgi:cytoskeletal protein CcmA (bactofilin family)